MDSLTSRRPSRTRSFAVWMGALLLGGFAASCETLDAGYHWLKGDFRVEVSGVPEEATSVYFILGNGEELTKAADSEEGYPNLILNGGLENHVETLGFSRGGDPPRWEQIDTILKDPERPLTSTIKTKDNTLLLKVHRDKFEKVDENTIAVIVRYNTDLDWQGVTVSMRDFETKEEAEVKVSNEGLQLTLFENYRKRQ